MASAGGSTGMGGGGVELYYRSTTLSPSNNCKRFEFVTSRTFVQQQLSHVLDVVTWLQLKNLPHDLRRSFVVCPLV